MASASWPANGTDTSLPPEGGYDLELFVNKEKIVEYICQICHDVSRECVEVSCGNGHIFCNNCIRYHFEINGTVCPADRTKDISITHNDFVRRKIMASNVRCKYYKFQCEWIGALRQFNHHTLHCQCKPIKCKYCKHSVSSPLLHEHYMECEEYLVRCSWCKNMYKRRILKDHTTTCYMKPVTCPNGCDDQIISNKLNHHLTEECPHRTVACPYKRYGCDQQIKYKDIAQHNKENEIKHIQQQMAYILAQNQQKAQQILQLQSRVIQMDAPDLVLVEGWGPQDTHINGIYKKQTHATPFMDPWGAYKSINDEKEVENKNRIGNHNHDNDREIVTRPYYTKCEDEMDCKLYFVRETTEWVFECNEFKGYCRDDAVYPTNIKNNKWNVLNRSMIVIDSIKINEIDVFQQILNKIPSNTLRQIITDTYTLPSNDADKDSPPDFNTSQGALYRVNETKTAVLNPSFVHSDEDKEDPELTADVIQNISDDAPPNKRTTSNASTVSQSSNESSHSRSRPMIRVSVCSPNGSNHSKWSVSVSIKLKYDKLYDGLLRTDANENNGNNNNTHHNPFGPPMVSNQSLYRYLTSVGYDSKLIKILWKLINSFNPSSNINNLLTRNGFVAICHLLDKITNLKYKIPTTLPIPLQPQQLNNLISTPVHQERLNNAVFPQVEEFEGTETQNAAPNAANSLLNFVDNDVFGFAEGGTELKQDFLNLKEASKSMDNLLIVESQTGSTASPKHSSDCNHVSSLEPLAFMTVASCMDSRSRTKPNTPNNDPDFLSVFPAPKDLVKSRSLDDSKKQKFSSKSANDIFGAQNADHVRVHKSYEKKTPSKRRNAANRNNNNNNGNAVSFGMDSNPRNDLDDLWDQSWHSSMNPHNKK